MILSLFRGLLELGFAAAGTFLFVSFALALEIGYRLGHRRVVRHRATSEDTPGISTLTAAMLGLLAFTMSLSIGFAQNRYEARRGLVMAEANAIGTAWLRAKLIDGEESPEISTKIEEYAKARLAFTTAASDADALPSVARAGTLQTDIWRAVQVVSHRAPNPVTTALINALNDMFDAAASQRFAYQSGVPDGPGACTLFRRSAVDRRARLPIRRSRPPTGDIVFAASVDVVGRDSVDSRPEPAPHG